MLNLLLNNNPPINDIENLVKHILNIVMPIILIISTAIAGIMTSIVFASGMKDVNGFERKEKIKRLIWIWSCYFGVAISSSIIICLTNLSHTFLN